MANVINSLKLGDGTYVFTTPYATCDTPSTTVEKVATITPGSNFSLETGARVAVKFTHANATSAPKLNVNSTGAKSIYFKNATITSSLNFWSDGQIVEFIYDGTNWNYSAAVSNADTKDTTGATNTSSKIYLIGATSQDYNPQTYSHDTVYVGTDGCLYSNNSQVVTLANEQTISGKKTFTGGVQFGTNTVFNNGGIQIPAANAFKVMGMHDVSLPSKTGTLALTSDIPDLSSFNTFDNAIYIEGEADSGNICNVSVNSTGSISYSEEEDNTELVLNMPIEHGATRTYTIATTNDVNNILTGSNTYTGYNSFSHKVAVTNGYNSAGLDYNCITRTNGTANYTLTIPEKSGTIALTSDIPSGGGSGDVTAAGNNIFTGTNHFQGGNTYFQTASGGPNDPMTTIDANGVLCKTSSDPGTYYKDTEIKHKNFTLTLPFKSGVLATTDDIPSTSSFVTTDTEQTISGIKTFTGGILVSQTTLGKTMKVSYGCNAIAYTPYGETNSKLISFPAKGGTFALTSDIPIKSATLSGTTLSITLS